MTDSTGESGFLPTVTFTSPNNTFTAAQRVQQLLNETGITGFYEADFADNITTIAIDAFLYDTKVVVVTINKVTTIGISAFLGCSSLRSITLDCAVDANKKYLLTSIGTNAFQQCTSLRNLHIPDTVKIIPNYMCYGCSSLEVAVMGYGYNRSGDTYVTDSTIGSNAFNNCYNLSYFVVPETVSSIGDLAFANNIALTHFYILGTPTVAADAFFQARSNTTIYYYNTTSNISSLFPTNTIKRPYTEYTITATGALSPATVRSTIPTTTYWKGKIAASVTSLAQGCFQGSSAGADTRYPYMVALSLPPNLNTIGYGAFLNTDGTSGYSCITGAFYIPNTVTTLVTINNTSNTFAGLNTTLRDTSTTKQIVFQSGPNTIAFPAITCNHTSAMAIIVPNVTSFGQECFNQANKVQLYSFFQKNAYTAATRLDHTTDDGGHNAFTWNFYKGGGYTHYLYIPKQITRMAIQLFRGIRDKIYVTAYHNSISTTGVTADTGLGFGFLSYSPTDGANNRFTGTTAPTLNIIYNFVDANGATLFGGTGIGNDANFFINVLYPSSVKTINQRFNVYTYLNSVAVDHNASQTVTIANDAFTGCTRLKYLYFNNRVKTIGFNAFRNAPLNSSFDLIDASPLEAIYHAAFISDNPYTCNIVQITIPKTVKALGTHVFACQQDVAPLINQKPAFTTLSFEDGIEFWGDYNYTLGSNTTLTAYEVNNNSSLKYMAIPAHFCQRCYSLQNVSFLDTAMDLSGTPVPNDGLALARPDNRLPIPTRYNKQILTNKIKRIGQLAFFCNYRLQSIRIPDGVTTIDFQAFYDNYSVTYLYLPDTLTTMGLGAFNYLGAINNFSYTGKEVSVRMPQNMIDFVVPETGSGGTGYFNTNATATRYFTVAFDNTSASGKVTNGVLGRFTNQASNAYIKYHVIIQNGITGLLGNSSGGTRAFDGFTGLKTLTIADTVTNIGPGAIEGCTGLTNVFISPTSNLTILDVNSFKTCSSLSSFFIPNSLRSIYETAFTGCTGLTNVFISPTSNLSSIGAGAFMSCSAITTFFIPNSVIRLGNDAFNNCAKLSSVTFGDNPGLKYIGNQAFVNSMNSLTRVHIPASVIYIGRAAFINYFTTTSYNNLTTVTFGAGSRLKSISGSCFGSYTGWSNSQPAKYLQNLVLPNSIQYMGTPNSAGTDISDSTGDVLRSTHTLAHSANLVMPSSLQCLSWAIFHDSGSFDVSNVYLPISLNPNPGPRRHNGYRTNSQGGEEFATSKSGSLLYSPSGFVLQNTGTGRAYSYYKTRSYSASPLITLDLFSSVTNTTDPINTTQIHAAIQEGVLVIGDGGANSIAGSTAGYRSNLISVNIPSTVTTISRNAFNGCKALVYVTFSENSRLTTIGQNAFRDCTMIHDITLPDTLTTIGQDAFRLCNNLATISIPYNVNSIGSGAFHQNKILSIKQIGQDIDGEAAGDQSGYSVSISADGTIVAVGAWQNDGTMGTTDDNRGHVRVYKYDPTKTTNVTDQSRDDFGPVGWRRLGQDIDGEAATDYSGYSVSLSADGSTLAIGANYNDGTIIGNAYDNRGHVRVYKYDVNKTTNDAVQTSLNFGPVGWRRLGPDIDGEATDDQSGRSVSLSADGTIVAIGAIVNDGTIGTTSDNRGHVRVYKYQTIADSTWTNYNATSLTYTGTSPNNKPIVVAGGDATPTPGKSYWVQIGGDIDGEALEDFSGFSVSLSADGSTVAIGANLNDGTTGDINDERGGHVRVYKYDSAKLTNVALQSDPDYGPVGWRRLGKDIDGEAYRDQSGYSVSLSANGLTVAIGAFNNDGTSGTTSDNRGHVRVYKYQTISDSTWTNYNATSLSYNGTTFNKPIVVAGGDATPTPGKSYWVQTGGDIDGEAANDTSGYFCSISADGTILAVGGYLNDGTIGSTSDNRGHVRVYQYDPTKTTNVTDQSSPDFGPIGWRRLGLDIDGDAAGDFFGASVSLSADGSTIAIGANANDGTMGVTSDNRGHVKVYQLLPALTSARIHEQLYNDISGTLSTYFTFPSRISFQVVPELILQINDTAQTNNLSIHYRQYQLDIPSIIVNNANDLVVAQAQLTSTLGFVHLDINYNIPIGAFVNNTNIYSVAICPDVTSIGDNAFSGCTNLTYLTFHPDSTCNFIGANAFYNTALSDLVLPDSLTSIGTLAFLNKISTKKLGEDIDGELAGDESGYSVSLSADGTIVAIGARYNDGTTVGSTSDNRGHVRVYKYDVTKTTNVTVQSSPDYGPVGWRRLGHDIDGELAGDWSGWSVSLSADGSTLAIGARNNDGTIGTTGDNRGHVRVYKYQTIADSTWTNYNANNFSYTGTSPNNKPIVVAGGDATPTPGKFYWVQMGNDIDGENAGDFSGRSVSLSADGTIVAIGASSNDGTSTGTSDSRGHVRVYKYDVNKTDNVTDQASDQYGPVGWRRLGKDIDGELASDSSGWSVSLSSDGTTVAIGAYSNDGTTAYDGQGHVRVYKYQTIADSTWTNYNANNFSYTGTSPNDKLIAVAGGDATPTPGKFYWVQMGNDIDGEAAGDQSGWSVSLSADGTILAIGANANNGNGTASGHVRVYKYDVNKTTNDADQSSPNYGPVGWRRLGQDIDGEAAGDFSGRSVSLSADGTILAIGADQNNGNGYGSGHVRVYQYDVNKTTNVIDQASLDYGPVGWRRLGQDIDGEGEATNDGSGISVSLSADGSTLAIGANQNNGNGSDSGHVKVYQLLPVLTSVRIQEELYNDISGTLSTYFAFPSQILFNVVPEPILQINDTPTVAQTNNLYIRYRQSQLGISTIFVANTNGLAIAQTQLASSAGFVHLDINYNIPIGAFLNNTKIYSVAIGPDVTSIGNNAFSGCINLAYLSFHPNSTCTVIGQYAFYNTALYDLVLPDSLTSIGTLAFPQNKLFSIKQIGQDIDGKVASDQAGMSVSMNIDGTIVAIGAPNSTNNSNEVRVYKYNGTTWQQLGDVIVGEANGDYSGGSVSLSSDGTIVAIGARWNAGTPVLANRGHVRIYKYDVTKTTSIIDQTSTNYGPVGWRRLGQDIDGEAAGDQSGYTISISADGTTVAICSEINFAGTPTWYAGHVRVYKYKTISDLNWNNYTVNSFTYDGGATYNKPIVANGGDTNPVTDKKYWVQMGVDFDAEAAYDQFGHSVSLSADGTIVAIGATYNDGTMGTNNDNRGHVRVYKYDPTKTTNVIDQTSNDFGPVGWRRLGQDIDGEATSDSSGWSVSLSADGYTVAIGASYNDGTPVINDRGQVRVYQYQTISDSTWTNYTVNSFTYTNKPVVVAGGDATPTPGKFYWVQTGGDIDGELAGDYSGQSVSLSADGTILAIGAYLNDGTTVGSTSDNRGHVRIYKYDVTKTTNVTDQNSSEFGPVGWRRLGQDIDGDAAGDYFGWSVSLSADGSTLAIGAFNNDGTTVGSTSDNRGHVRVYQLLSPRPLNSVYIQEQLYNDISGTLSTYFTFPSQILFNVVPELISQDNDAAISFNPTISQTNNLSIRYLQYQLGIPTILVTNANDLAVAQTQLASIVGFVHLHINYDIPISAFANNTKIYSVTIGPDVTSIGNNAFSGCTNLAYLSFHPNSTCAVIGANAFYNNSHYNLALPDSLTSIGSGAFHWNANAPISISSASIINVIKLGPDIDGEAAGDQSGISVSLSADGSTLAIGTSINDGTTGITSDNRGHVRVYKYQTITDATWTNYNATSFTYTGTSPNNKPIVVAGGDATPTPGKSYWVQNGADIDGEALGDFSGGSVSLSADGSTLAIGAGSNDGTIGTTSDNRGHVRVYKYQTIADSTWTNYNATSFTYTGTSPNNKPIAVAGGDATPTPGKSYWVQNGGDIDGELAGDSSGISVSLSADGSTVAIGANFNDGTTTSTSDNRGHVRVYKYDVNKITNVTDQSSDQYGPVGWRRLGKDIDGEALEDNSGGSVSLSADGLTVANGARNNDGTTVISTGFSSDSRGHVRVYKYQTIADSTWTNYNATSLTYTGTSPNNKPIVVAGGDATPTPGKSYWVQIGGDIDGEAGGNYFYGFSCSLSADGSTVAIGAGSNNDNGLASGHVRVYKYDATKITNVIDQASDDFGPVGWRRRGKDIDGEAANDGAGFSGYPVSLSADGTIVAIGATSNDGTTGNTADNRGHVRIYQYDATKTTNVTDQASLDYGPAGWRRIGQDIDGEALSDNFGQSVSLSADGSTVAIGASYNDGTTVISTGFSSDNRGHVRVYKLNPTLTYDASVYIHEELYNNISGTLSTYFTNLSNVSFVVVRERLTSSSRITISQINNFYIRYRQYQLGIQTIAVNNIFDFAFAQAQLASSSGFIHLYINYDIPINAFAYNTKIYSVAIGPDVTSIGFGAFNGCTNLTYLSFHPDSICTTIGQGAFLGNNIFDLALPDSLTTIVGWAFQNSTQLTSVCIPNKVTSLGTGAFYNCSKLTSVALPASLTSYGTATYFNTNGTTVPTNMAVYNSYMDHTIPHFKLSDYSIPTGIVQNVIPSEVTYIDHRAYAYYPEITLYAINVPQTSGPYSYAANGVQFPIMPAAFLLNGGTIVSHSMFPLYRSIPDLNVYTVSSTASDKVDDTDDYYILMPGYSICIYNNLYDEENLFTDTPTYRYYDNEFGKVPLNIDVGTYNTASSILFMHKGRILSKKFVN